MRILLFVFIMLLSAPAFADCTLSGTAVCGGVSCAGETRPDGHILYNADHTVMQYCAGTEWKSAINLMPACSPGDSVIYTSSGWSCTSSCTNNTTATCTLDATRSNGDPQFTAANIVSGVNILGVTGTASAAVPPTLCPNIGNVCDDGNAGNNPDPKFAGYMVYGGSSVERLYVTQANQSSASAWKTSTGANDIATDSMEDGQVNDGQVANSATFPAFKLCKDLVYGGFDDWYLPAVEELYLLWKTKTAVGGFGATDYWSSTEVDTIDAWKVDFDGGETNNRGKTNAEDVRCVRRD